MRLSAMWDGFGDDLLHSLLQPFPPIRNGAKLALSLPKAAWSFRASPCR